VEKTEWPSDRADAADNVGVSRRFAGELNVEVKLAIHAIASPFGRGSELSSGEGLLHGQREFPHPLDYSRPLPKAAVKRCRAAMTLPEVMVAVTLSSLVMGVLITLTIALKQRDRTIRSFAVESERRGELAELLRTDIRSATGVSLASATMLVVKRPGGGEVRYDLAASGCNRTVVEPNGSKVQFDSYVVGTATSWSLAPGPAGRRPLFVVTLNRSPGSKDTEARQIPLLVYGALGADLPAGVAAARAE
jgi:hypothetical protein